MGDILVITASSNTFVVGIDTDICGQDKAFV